MKYSVKTILTGAKKKKMSVKLLVFLYLSALTCVLGAKKNGLIETVLLSTHNICFGSEVRKIIYSDALSGGLGALCSAIAVSIFMGSRNTNLALIQAFRKPRKQSIFILTSFI